MRLRSSVGESVTMSTSTRMFSAVKKPRCSAASRAASLPKVPMRTLSAMEKPPLFRLAVALDFSHQIPDYRDVDQNDDHSHGPKAPYNSDNFERNERGGNDDRQIFRPPLAQQQARALGEEERRVEKGADLGEPQFPVIDSRDFGQQLLDNTALASDQ